MKPPSAPLAATIDPTALFRLRRSVQGISAVLLPFTAAGAVDWNGFAAHVARTAAAGIVPAVNMDTGYVHLLDDATRRQVLAVARQTLGSPRPGDLVAGACVVDRAGERFDERAYLAQCEPILAAAATPVLFPSWGLNAGSEVETVDRTKNIAARLPAFIGFELSPRFVPCGRILSVGAWLGLLDIPNCLGAKHSSLSRRLEWQRLALRDRERPDFRIYTGNDLAIDMVRYGSDWLLGLSTAAPEAFAKRDAWWAAADPRFDELDDALQALGDFAFRTPIPAYKHSMAQVLTIRGWIGCDEPCPGSLRRPESDREIIAAILERIDAAAAADQ
jgi:dihydrodipicolinate synthase/N-acetylneuraminate lyase